jgi:hypothetical protein
MSVERLEAVVPVYKHWRAVLERMPLAAPRSEYRLPILIVLCV